jgi:hypothetical protein
MMEAQNCRHLMAEFEVAEGHVARGRGIIHQVKEGRRRVAAAGSSPSQESDKLLELLEFTQQLFENHLDLVSRELFDLKARAAS